MAAGLVVGAALAVLFTSLSTTWWHAVPFACAVANVSSYLLRRRAGVPQMTRWDRYRRWRRSRREPA